jgi:hypothetical protein
MSNQFHSKYHRHNHHTNPTIGESDSATDPIASPADPFQGDFIINGGLSATSLTAVDIFTTDIFATSISATEIHAISSYTHYQDILVSELSGFNVTGDVTIEGSVSMTGCLSTDCIRPASTLTTPISVHSNLDMMGYSISGIGNNSLTFESGLKISSDEQARFRAPTAYSTAFGTASAYGLESFAEGSAAEAIGTSSHAEGNSTASWAYASHAEGISTITQGDASHAEGTFTVASGFASHAEGNYTTASGYASHAEGEYTKTLGHAAHTEGFYTSAIGDYSHAEGSQSIALSAYSSATGRKARANHEGSRVESDGVDSYTDSTSANQYTAEFANGYRFLGGPMGTDAIQELTENSFSIKNFEGDNWIEFNASGIELFQPLIVDDISVINLSAQNILVSELSGLNITGDVTIEGSVSMTGCLSTDCIRPASTLTTPISVHSDIDMMGYSISGIGNNSLTFESGAKFSSDVNGGVRVTSLSGIALGSSNTASGLYSVAEGYNTIASGNVSHTEGLYTSAIGYYSHAEGELSTASNQGAHAEGYMTVASGQYSHAEGFYTVASGQYSHAEGYQSIALSAYSSATGRKARANHEGSRVESDGVDSFTDSTADNQYTAEFANGYRFLGGPMGTDAIQELTENSFSIKNFEGDNWIKFNAPGIELFQPLIVDDITVINLSAQNINASPLKTTVTITSSNLVSGEYIFAHNRNDQLVFIQTYDNSYQMMIPDNITLTNANSATIDFSTFEPLVGNIHIIAI